MVVTSEPAVLAHFASEDYTGPSVSGVILLDGTSSQSPASRDPLIDDFDLDETTLGPWNPTGRGWTTAYFPWPVVRVGPTDSATILTQAAVNTDRDYKGNLHYGRITHDMYASPWDRKSSYSADSVTSLDCLSARTCAPIASYSAASLFPSSSMLSDSATDSSSLPLDILLVVAAVDARTWLYNATAPTDTSGAEAMSGAYVLGAAISILGDTLASLSPAEKGALIFQRQAMFVPLAGEPWGHTGSRRLAYELHRGTATVFGVKDTRVTDVLELGLLGNLGSSQKVSLHTLSETVAGSSGERPTALVQALLDGFENNNDDDDDEGLVLEQKTDGLPASSSIQSIFALQGNTGAKVRAVSLNDFEAKTVYPYLGGEMDTLNILDPDYGAMGRVACAVARAIVTLTVSSGLPSGDITEVVTCGNAESYVRQWAACLNQGMDAEGCLPLSEDLLDGIGSSLGFPGILSQVAVGDEQSPKYKHDVTRLFWNHMGRAFGAIHGEEEEEQQLCDQLGNHECPVSKKIIIIVLLLCCFNYFTIVSCCSRKKKWACCFIPSFILSLYIS